MTMKLATLTETWKDSVEDRLTQIQRDMREVKRRLEKESKDEGEDGPQATKKLKDEGDDGPLLQLKDEGDGPHEKKPKDEGDDGPHAKELKDEGDVLHAQMPCNVIQFCQTRNWIFDLDRKKWECSNCYQNGQNGFSWEIVEWEDETTNARSTKWRCCSCNQVGREYTELAAATS